MAQKKGGGSTRNGRDSKPKMLGVKAFGGELISAGSIIVRQRGTTPVRTSVWARITLCSLWWTAMCLSRPRALCLSTLSTSRLLLKARVI